MNTFTVDLIDVHGHLFAAHQVKKITIDNEKQILYAEINSYKDVASIENTAIRPWLVSVEVAFNDLPTSIVESGVSFIAEITTALIARWGG